MPTTVRHPPPSPGPGADACHPREPKEALDPSGKVCGMVPNTLIAATAFARVSGDSHGDAGPCFDSASSVGRSSCRRGRARRCVGSPLHDAEVAAVLAVLATCVGSQEHAPIVRPSVRLGKGVGLHYSRLTRPSDGTIGTYARKSRDKSAIGEQTAKVGLTIECPMIS